MTCKSLQISAIEIERKGILVMNVLILDEALHARKEKQGQMQDAATNRQA